MNSKMPNILRDKMISNFFFSFSLSSFFFLFLVPQPSFAQSLFRLYMRKNPISVLARHIIIGLLLWIVLLLLLQFSVFFFDYYFFHKLSILLDVFGSEWEHGKHILVAFFCCYFFLLLFSIDFFPFFITTSNLFVYTVEDFLVSFIQHGLHSFQIFAFFSFHFFFVVL